MTSLRLLSDFLDNPLLFIIIGIVTITLFLIYFFLEDKLEKWLRKNRKRKLNKLKRSLRIFSIFFFWISFCVPPINISINSNTTQLPIFTVILMTIGVYFHLFRKTIIEFEKQGLCRKEKRKIDRIEEKKNRVGCLWTIFIIAIIAVIGCFV